MINHLYVYVYVYIYTYNYITRNIDSGMKILYTLTYDGKIITAELCPAQASRIAD